MSYWNKLVDAFSCRFLDAPPGRCQLVLYVYSSHDALTIISRRHRSVPVAPHEIATFTFLIPSDLPPKLCCDL